MFRYFTYKQTYEYVKILQDLVYNYNHRPHRSLGGKSPNDVNASNEATLWKHMYVVFQTRDILVWQIHLIN